MFLVNLLILLPTTVFVGFAMKFLVVETIHSFNEMEV